ncbi:MAG: hypothetical protein AUK48_13860 [Oscillatoriales cyanobacterium CG2_30_44_21]|nr:MAG: hypothetical protein AUK48_13860 [Oscillatoriales cyanobacterium CG2_30_44_21]
MSQSLNFANQNLCDRSFKGKNLIGADFSGADLRGCDFCYANLKDANFTNVVTGKSQRQKFSFSILAFVMAMVFAGTAMITSILLITFAIVFILGTAGINREVGYGVAIVATVVFAVGFTITFTGSFTISGGKGVEVAIVISLVTAFMSGLFGANLAKLLVTGAFNAIANALRINSLASLLLFLAIELLQILGSLYLFRLAINLLRSGIGTKFRYADLSRASFQNANLISCDFSSATIRDVNWQKSQISRCKMPSNFDS